MTTVLGRCCRPMSKLRSITLFLATIGVALLVFINNEAQSSSSEKLKIVKEIFSSISSKRSSSDHVSQSLINFDGFDNETGVDHLIVPNLIHFIRFNKTELSFTDFLCLRAAYQNQKPDFIYIHTDVGGLFTGKYWDWIQRDEEMMSRIRLNERPVPREIFGQPLSTEWLYTHGSDVARIQILMEFGGIYLDNDVFVIQNLDKYRKYEITMNWDENQFIGNQVFVAHKDARFLKLCLESYKDNYHSDLWYYNGGERPTVEILYRQPELLHRVKGNFGADMGTSMSLYMDRNFDWRQQDTIHLLINHRSYMNPDGYKEIPEFDENNVQNYTFPFGEMAREILLKFDPLLINHHNKSI